MKPEIVSPAGSLENLKTAVLYGADAVYCGAKRFSLRARADNFTMEELAEGISFAHARGVKVYLTANAFLRNDDFVHLLELVGQAVKLGVDAVIVSDPGVFLQIRQQFPDLRLHVSTQANTVNAYGAQFWQRQGASRVVLARELSFDQIGHIAATAGVETEIFVHGAMCMAYSGRCYLSRYMSDRDANQGECNQTCRWQYRFEEEQRPDTYYTLEQHDGYTSFFNSKDLCCIDLVPEMVSLGIDAIKIEGRMRTPYYTGLVTKMYREAVDCVYNGEGDFEQRLHSRWYPELDGLVHREYTHGFYGAGDDKAMSCDRVPGKGRYQFCGVIKERLDEKEALVNVRGPLVLHDEVEVVAPHGGSDVKTCVVDITYEGRAVTRAPLGKDAKIVFDQHIGEYGLLRKETT